MLYQGMNLDPRLQTTTPEDALHAPMSVAPPSDINEHLCAALDSALADAFDHCLDTLFYTASAASDEAQHKRCIETVRELRAKQPVISSAFVAQIRRFSRPLPQSP